ncbi:branched-chain amino acid ABC transporter permease [Aquihabitans sp. G128]|uniref:branched-chain amino acid ABC transporter permease n=1 Tax=Aquihabitans sp. G128 TaxID=2849779 RepID=UPI001C2447E7|nr:branched-chain amino acid ABC transporter permease [Aquihabitans sp. G128]QXC59714.1 branched-chain amino acid ABC transporter permease [Aquihabitans sp. G128]
MDLARSLRNPRVLLLLLALGVLWPGTAAGAQTPTTKPAADGVTAADEAKCKFTKQEAIEANGGPLGPSIWGRLCQVIDGKATFAKGATITVSQGGKEIADDTTGADGVFVVTIPGNGTYQVALDPKTLPKGFSLTDEDRAVLSNVQVNLGDQQSTFRLGEDDRGQRDLSDYATTVAKGVRLGLILAVAAVGLSLVYGVTGLTNFAHAELVTWGAIATYLANSAGVPFWLAVPIGMVAGAVAGLANDRAIWAPLRKRRMALLSMMVVSIGLSTAVRNLFQVAYGPAGKRYTAASGQLERSYGPFRLTPNDVIIMVICVAVLIGMTVLLRSTRLGTAIRAVADNADLAASSGIAVDRIITTVWVICGALAALGGTLYGLTINVKFDMGFVLLLSMFAAIVLGGLGNAYGAVLGALVIGVVQETSGLFIDTAYKFVVALLVLILVLLVRPQGILGQRERFG